MPEDRIVSEPIHTNSEQNLDTSAPAEQPDTLRAIFHAPIDQYQLLKFIVSTCNVRLAVAIFLIGTFRGISLRALTQYASARFGWKLSSANGLISEVATVNLVLFFIVMSVLISMVGKYLKLANQPLNLGIVKASLSLQPPRALKLS